MPLFHGAYDRSGGEDYDLFRRAAAAGARMAWCAEAVVVEPAPPDQLRARRLLARYWSTGLTTARIDRSFDGPARTWRTALKGLAGSALRGSAATLRGDRDAAAQAGADARPLRRPRRRALRRREPPLRRAMTGPAPPPRRRR